MTKARPKTREPRAVQQPLNIDRLPPSVHDAIALLRNVKGKSWAYIEELSSLSYAAKWDDPKNFGRRGFVDWDSLPTDVLELFPRLRIPHSTLHRWWDIRVAQVAREVAHRSEQARAIAESFIGAGIDGEDDAVLNATRDAIFAMLQSEDSTSRGKVVTRLLQLAEVRQGKRANDIKERAVAVAEREIAKREQEWNLKFERLRNDLDKTVKKARGKEMTPDEIRHALATIRKNTFG